MIPNREKVAEFDKLGVPWRNVVAFVGHIPPEDEMLYELIHGKGAAAWWAPPEISTGNSSAGRWPTSSKLEPDYRAFLKRGADLIETDIPRELGPLLFSSTSPPASKKAFFFHALTRAPAATIPANPDKSGTARAAD